MSVEPEDFHDAAVTLDRQGRQFDPVQHTLLATLRRYTGCAGVDRYGKAFDAAYQQVIAGWFHAVDRAVNLLSDITNALDQAGFPQRLTEITDRLHKLNTTLTAAVDSTPNPNVTTTSPTGVTDVAAMQSAENLGNKADSDDLPGVQVGVIDRGTL